MLNENRAVIHLLLHVLVPLSVAYFLTLFYGKGLIELGFKSIFLWLMITMVVDIDHVLATPIYSPGRCSIWFHPLHTLWPILLYCTMMVWPIVVNLLGSKINKVKLNKVDCIIGLVGLGLVIHMLLDWTDCLWMRACD